MFSAAFRHFKGLVVEPSLVLFLNSTLVLDSVLYEGPDCLFWTKIIEKKIELSWKRKAFVPNLLKFFFGRTLTGSFSELWSQMLFSLFWQLFSARSFSLNLSDSFFLH